MSKKLNVAFVGSFCLVEGVKMPYDFTKYNKIQVNFDSGLLLIYQNGKLVTEIKQSIHPVFGRISGHSNGEVGLISIKNIVITKNVVLPTIL